MDRQIQRGRWSTKVKAMLSKELEDKVDFADARPRVAKGTDKEFG